MLAEPSIEILFDFSIVESYSSRNGEISSSSSSRRIIYLQLRCSLIDDRLTILLVYSSSSILIELAFVHYHITTIIIVLLKPVGDDIDISADSERK